MNNEKDKARAIVNKVKKQIPSSPEARLMFAVFQSVVIDLFSKAHHRSAAKYMRSNMPHLVMIDIDPEWVRRLFKQSGLSYLYEQ